MERVAECNGVLFINDSKATNPASAAPALAAFPPNPEKRLHWIVGGLPKGDDLDDCAPWPITRRPGPSSMRALRM
jgi:UDP-N-acetylmuramoylalanine--D-glutamate ligase